MNLIVHVSIPTLYEYEGWKFEYSRRNPFGPWPVKNNLKPRKYAGKKFYAMFERFYVLSIAEQESYRIKEGE